MWLLFKFSSKILFALLLLGVQSVVFACSAFDPPATYASVSSCIKSRIFMKPIWIQRPPEEQTDRYTDCISSTFLNSLVTIGSASNPNGKGRYWFYNVKTLNPNDSGANTPVPAYEVKQIETCTIRFLAGEGPTRRDKPSLNIFK